MSGFVTVSQTTRPPAETFAYIVDLTNWPSFRGWGPLPGIVSAELVGGGSHLAAGARVRVTNTDGSIHLEVVEELVVDRRYRVRMELGSPANRLLAQIDEIVELAPSANGTRIVRSFEVTPRSLWTAPLAWLIAKVFLRRAVLAHDLAVARALADVRA